MTVEFWDLGTFRQLARLDGHSSDVCSVSFNADGSKLATSSNDKSIIVWDTKTWEKISTFKSEKNNRIWDANFSNNGRYIVGGMDSEATIWTLENGKKMANFQKQNGNIRSSCFSNDDQLLVTGGGDRKVKVWDLATGNLVADLSGMYFGADELDLVRSGLEDTMIMAYDSIMAEWESISKIKTMRTAAFVVTLRKIGGDYAMLGIFP